MSDAKLPSTMSSEARDYFRYRIGPTFSTVVPRKVIVLRHASCETDAARSTYSESVLHVPLQGTF